MAVFHEKFKELIETSSLNQLEIADVLGVSRYRLYNWTSGRGEPDIESLKAIAKNFDVSIDWLLGESSVKKPGYPIEEVLPENIIYSESPIRLITGANNFSDGIFNIIYEKEDGTAAIVYITNDCGKGNDDCVPLSKMRFVDGESVVVWRTVVKNTVFGSSEEKEVEEILISRKMATVD